LGGALVFGNSVRDDTSASTLHAAQPLHKTGYGRSSLYAEAFKVFIAQNALVATVQASHLYNELRRFHDQSSSASRVTAGAFGFPKKGPLDMYSAKRSY
jgi:hypothetical protein